MRFKQPSPPGDTAFPIAPMVDIVFQLLLFYMVASVYANWETKVDVQVPTASRTQQAPRQATEIIVNVTDKGVIYINATEVDHERLRAILGAIATSYPGSPVIIRADKRAPFEHVMAVLDDCRQMDIWNVRFATLDHEPAAPPPAAE